MVAPAEPLTVTRSRTTFSITRFLAGGLSPEDIDEALELGRTAGIDINSGVETRPGGKYTGLIVRLFGRIRSLITSALVNN